MIVTVLGSSGSVPGPNNPCSGYLVEHGGHRLLLDLGTGAFGTLLTYARPDQVDTVVVTHRHGDHSADLAALAYAQEKLAPRAEPTRVIAPAGTRAGASRTSPLAFEDSRPGELDRGPFRLRLVPVRHSVETYAVRVETGGGSLTYTGDSGPCRALLDLALDTGLLLAEAALGPGDAPGAARGRWDDDAAGPPPHHLTARQTGELAAAAGTGLLAVTHLRPWEDAGRSLAAAAARFGGPVLLARPGLRLAPGRSARAPNPKEET
ncbi:Ribonuclease BN, tRNA processing enzyme [Streptomyces sp. 2131.1]|uniref:MBL fold metallo-hydrolase n=1 Tax=Streptomyces sp. 2131.1 TaxID=1855346 RepID=UPI000896383E|nr:MBL fold metallo-hydrolase [Streptomyces sp. 2131.1]SEE50108.1 Ribonuclease BN, tRNA processing enzyme [Streptomyces sp. 2131.1]